MWNLNYDTNELTYETETLTDIENRLVVTNRERGGMDWEFGVSRCKLVYIEWINTGPII